MGGDQYDMGVYANFYGITTIFRELRTINWDREKIQENLERHGLDMAARHKPYFDVDLAGLMEATKFRD
jgi:hypothetical protein